LKRLLAAERIYDKVDSTPFGSISVRVASRGNFAAEEVTMSNPAHSRVAAYHWYLGSAFWRERREFILERASHICEKCGKRRATEVHHLTYIRVFQELPSDLVALCKPCHAEIHWRQPANDNQIQFSFYFLEKPEA
jgi:5-methylcytosine-specific restriction endonuclease McrA